MPQHLKISTFEYNLIVWNITEPLEFFTEQLNNWSNDFHNIKSPLRKLQYASSRYAAALLTQTNDASLFGNTEDRRPFIKNSDLKISISHDENWVAVIIGKSAVGIDIFCPTEKILRIAHKFISDIENDYFNTISKNENEILQHYSMLWCIKETVFKWMGKDGVEFKEDMFLQNITNAEAIVNTTFFGPLKVSLHTEKAFCLSWTGQL